MMLLHPDEYLYHDPRLVRLFRRPSQLPSCLMCSQPERTMTAGPGSLLVRWRRWRKRMARTMCCGPHWRYRLTQREYAFDGACRNQTP